MVGSVAKLMALMKMVAVCNNAFDIRSGITRVWE